MSTKKKYKESESVVIMRSQINFAPYNPKNHSKEQVDQIKSNIKRIGLLGGIIWNALTGNLVDGHKRVSALDVINKYDGSNDYDIRVEKCELTDKQEKEQNVFQSKSRTEVDLFLLSEIIDDIDIEAAGITEEDIEIMEIENPNFNYGKNEDAEQYFELSEEEKQAKKQKIKQAKSDTKSKTEAEPYVTLTFSSFEAKAFFMERFGFDHYDLFIKGESFDKRIEIID